MREVVVTGMGVVTPLGLDLPRTWDGILSGRCGVDVVGGLEDIPVRIAGQVPDFEPAGVLGVRAARSLDRFAQLAVLASREARAQAGLSETEGDGGWGTVVGTGLGGVDTCEKGLTAIYREQPMSVYTAASMVPSSATAAVAMDAGARGPALSPATACASGTDAIGLGSDLIRFGRADVVLAGGADAPVTRGMMSAFAAMRAASTRNQTPDRACRPFDIERDGLVVGEGAAVVILESAEGARRRGAPVLAEVAGYAAANDAYHLTAPRPDVGSARTALHQALAQAGADPGAVDYVNAHATGTPRNDEAEARLLREELDPDVPVSGVKGTTGHLMGAAGALEAALCVQTLRHGLIPPTVNCDEIDPACKGINVVRDTTRMARAAVAVSLSLGFGGHNAALVLRNAPGNETVPPYSHKEVAE